MSSCPSPSLLALAPNVQQDYKVLHRKQVSPDSVILDIALPEDRPYLGWEPTIPTCIKVEFADGVNMKTGQQGLSKSYSPISHPSTPNLFQLLVKAYAPVPGGGVGDYLCRLQPGDYLTATVKKPRIMHESTAVLGRWNHVGLIGGGTGIAPLFQIATILLEDPHEKTKIQVLSINKKESDILLKEEMDAMANKYPDRFQVTYTLTGDDDANNNNNHHNNSDATTAATSSNSDSYWHGRGSLEMIQSALPSPTQEKVMVLVCGRDGFVEHWAGPVARGPSVGGKKGPKVQGPLLGLLQEAGFDASQVFKY